MFKKVKTKIGYAGLASFSALLYPTFVLAQPSNFAGFVDILVGILRALVPVVFALTLLAILWAGSQMMLHADNPQKLEDGKRTLFWGIIVLFVMISIWGFVNLLRNSVLL